MLPAHSGRVRWSLVLSLALVCTVARRCASAVSLDPPAEMTSLTQHLHSNFTAELLRMKRDGLGVIAMQNYYDSLNYEETTLDGAVLIQQLADALEQKYRERLEALEGLRASVVQSYREDEAGRSAFHIVPDCCNLNSDLYEEDVRFKSKVNTQAMCMSQSAVAPDPGHMKRLHDTVLDRMRANLQNVPSLKWQYYGDENGVITTFPSVAKKDCHKYDPRFRYVWTSYQECIIYLN
ncbi:PREDICTED: VWFA and cache domain-containing protein 1-like [Priapulus caudatus]|uniref:VWFA and cache domain-containing protein 1-like n=1 Tax=Priapulus caudatus TaxID=37621 RepID=A0ABM1EVU8_PRICU|nr:PREDICTED: VWFA and cache domain-containing protein 1-like [Priapulus caudatus]